MNHIQGLTVFADFQLLYRTVPSASFFLLRVTAITEEECV